MFSWIESHNNINPEVYKQALIKLGFTNGKFLDVGCNAGYYSFAALELGNEVVGIDTDPDAIEEANKTRNSLIGQHDRIHFYQKNIFEFCNDDEFDFIFCNNSIQYILTHKNLKDPFIKFEELSKFGGKLFVGCVPDWGAGKLTTSKRKQERIIDQELMNTLGRQRGFEMLVLYHHFDTHEIDYQDVRYRGMDLIRLKEIAEMNIIYSMLFQQAGVIK